MIKKLTSSKMSLAGIVMALASSLCCVTPVIAAVGGISGIGSTFSWVEPVRPYLIIGTYSLLAFAFYRTYRATQKDECNCEEPSRKSFVNSKTFLWTITFVTTLLISFPYYSKAFFKSSETAIVLSEKSKVQTVQVIIKGMTCTACEEHVNHELAKVSGIAKYNTSYETGISNVEFDSGVTNVDNIIKAINKTGYSVTAHSILKSEKP